MTTKSLTAALLIHEVLEICILGSIAFILWPNPTSGLYHTPLMAPDAHGGPSLLAPFFQAVLTFDRLDVSEVHEQSSSVRAAHGTRRSSSRISDTSHVSMASMTRRRSSFAGSVSAGESKDAPSSRGLPSDLVEEIDSERLAVPYPWWLMIPRSRSTQEPESAGHSSSTNFVVVIQNPTKSATAMAAKCTRCRATIMMGEPHQPRRGSWKRQEVQIQQPHESGLFAADHDELSSESSEDTDINGEGISRRRLSSSSNNSSSSSVGPWRRHGDNTETTLEMVSMRLNRRGSNSRALGGNTQLIPPPPPLSPPPPNQPTEPRMTSASQARMSRLRRLSNRRLRPSQTSLSEPLNTSSAMNSAQ